MYNGNLTLTFDKAGNYGAYVTSSNTLGYVDSKWIEFTVYDKSPTYGKLESEWGQYKFVVGETIPLVVISNLATEYWLGFDKGSECIITEEMQNGRHSVVVTEKGEYSAYVSISNKYGGIDSDRIYFSVYDKAPTFGTLEIIDEKTIYFVGDTIRLKANSDYASEYWIGIDKEKERITTGSMQDAVYELTLTEAGEYSAYVSVSNGLGGLDSKSVYFKVYNKSEIQGDINNDNKLNVADAVLLQKWLLDEPDIELVNWKAADICEDGRLNVFDMIEMRKLIINSQSAQ
ncbi:MAG: dockerin type I repeat-containing protein [Ruminococcus sp.]|nr:dockerin type I repeat-containing protein [Ruminococcus sp.]